MKETTIKARTGDVLKIIIGTALTALAVNRIFAPAELVTGGVSGLSIVLTDTVQRMSGTKVPLWMLNLLLNIPLFAAAFHRLGWRAVKRSLCGTVLLIGFQALIPEKGIGLDDRMLTAIFGGVVCGLGIGLVLSAGGSTGGTDLAAILLNRKFRSVKVTQLLLILDGAIVLAGVWAFGLQTALYAVTAIYIVTTISDRVLAGIDDALAIYIISDDSRGIAGAIMEQLGRGATYLRIIGGYSGEEREMVFCVVGKRELPAVKDIVRLADEKAFVIVNKANEVLGEGFRNISADGL